MFCPILNIFQQSQSPLVENTALQTVLAKLMIEVLMVLGRIELKMQKHWFYVKWHETQRLDIETQFQLPSIWLQLYVPDDVYTCQHLGDGCIYWHVDCTINHFISNYLKYTWVCISVYPKANTYLWLWFRVIDFTDTMLKKSSQSYKYTLGHWQWGFRNIVHLIITDCFVLTLSVGFLCCLIVMS